MSQLTDALDPRALASAVPQGASSAPLARGTLIAAVTLAVAASLVAGFHAASAQGVEAAGPELTRVLRFMAAVKAAFAVGAVWLAWWRFGYPATYRVAAACIAACALMAAGPGLIWSVTHVALGAVLFHAGLALLLAVCWADRASTHAVVASAVERRRARRRPTAPQVSAA